jgi:hypothetical protein
MDGRQQRRNCVAGHGTNTPSGRRIASAHRRSRGRTASSQPCQKGPPPFRLDVARERGDPTRLTDRRRFVVGGAGEASSDPGGEAFALAAAQWSEGVDRLVKECCFVDAGHEAGRPRGLGVPSSFQHGVSMNSGGDAARRPHQAGRASITARLRSPQSSASNCSATGPKVKEAMTPGLPDDGVASRVTSAADPGSASGR